jgi:hypothetical protein
LHPGEWGSVLQMPQLLEPDPEHDDLHSHSQLLHSLCAAAGPGEEDRMSMVQMLAMAATLRREVTQEAILIL